MLLVWILTWILQSLAFEPAVMLWHWFGDNVLLTILMLLFLA
jgi:hypothetical protein